MTHAVAAGLNREQRRQQERAQRGRPAARRVRSVQRDPVMQAMGRISLLQPQQIAYILQPPRASFKHTREGVATLDDWKALMALVYLGQAIEKMGTVRGLHEHFAAAERALEAIYTRVQEGARDAAWGRSVPLYFQEIEAIREAIHFCDFQLQHLAATELEQARHRALSDPRSRRLNAPPAPTTPTPQIQEKLL